MPTSQQHPISYDQSLNDPEFASIPNQASCEQSDRPNILDQGFILYSDDEIQSNSQSLTEGDSHSELSNLSRQSSCSSIENSERNEGLLLRGFSNGGEESSVYNIHESECSESGLELLHQLQPLFKGKVFLRRSPRFAVYGVTVPPSTITANNNLKQQVLLNKAENIDLVKKQIQSQMIEDDRPTSSTQNNPSSSRIIQENYQPSPAVTSIFSRVMTANNNHPIIESKQQETQNTFVRFTRSSKKSIHQETEMAFSNINKNSTLNLFGSTSKQTMTDNEYVSQVTKDFLLMNRKEKKIKKQQQKQGHCSYSLKCLRKRQSSFQRPSN